MTKIGLLSDTHGYLPDAVFNRFADCDEIWHAGDFGSMQLVQELRQFKPLRGVYGNIDENEIIHDFPEQLIFTCENVKVLMKHIGGYPGRYAPGIKSVIQQEHAQLFISGHSHILKIMFDPSLQCLHINPGAAGKQGWHLVQTLVKFEIEDKDIKNCKVVELGKK
jgi:putative phosphoesterase